MSRTLRVAIDPATVSPAKAIAATARTGPLVCLTHRSFRDLADELGSLEAAFRHLHRVVENVGKPLGINFPNGEDRSRTVFIAPRSWTPERLQGWIAGHHQAIEAMFGGATLVPLEDL
jgi:hypothetical protein